MLIVSDRPLFIGEELHPAGIPFELADRDYVASLLERGAARPARPPRVIYEIEASKQNDGAIREQGVTCLCVTRNRGAWLAKAIEAYLAQSYEPRELLILADGQDVSGIVPKRPDIQLVQIEE